MKIYLGVDWGRRRVGVAVSDGLGLLAHPLGTLEDLSLDKVADRLVEWAKERQADGVVLGLPRHMDGREGESAEAARRLADQLIQRGLAVQFWDERLTSREAEDRLRAGGASARRRRGKRDQAAAAVILQSFLDAARRDA